MDVGIIDWKNVDSRFVRDEMYELINAPKWTDLLASDDPLDDEAWFCRTSCNHPKTAEDFFHGKERTPTSNSKLPRSARVSEILPFGEEKTRYRLNNFSVKFSMVWVDLGIVYYTGSPVCKSCDRDTKLKKRATNPTSVLLKDTNHRKILEYGENQDPNFSTPPNHKAKLRKETIKSSTEKKPRDDSAMRNAYQIPKLKSTLSARDLFSGGGDILTKVAEFCNELKKLATKVRNSKDIRDIDSGELNAKEKEKKPFLELSREDVKDTGTRMSKEKQLKIRRKDDAENNNPILSVDVKNIKDGLPKIRTLPPTPQSFSANRGTLKAESTPKTFMSKPQGRGILQEVEQTNKESNQVKHEKINHEGETPVEAAEKEARTLNAFWFLKPCTLSSY